MSCKLKVKSEMCKLWISISYKMCVMSVRYYEVSDNNEESKWQNKFKNEWNWK